MLEWIQKILKIKYLLMEVKTSKRKIPIYLVSTQQNVPVVEQQLKILQVKTISAKSRTNPQQEQLTCNANNLNLKDSKIKPVYIHNSNSLEP